MKEQEYKFLVSKGTLDHLIKETAKTYFVLDSHKRIQINYYYDTDDLKLLKQNVTLRARQTEYGLKLEEKSHSGSDLTVSIENEYTMEQLSEKIDHHGCECKLKGVLVTERTEFILDEGLKIDFDKNYYLGICDCEIEIEFSENKKEQAKMLCKDLGLMNANTNSKYSRFFNYKLSQHGPNTYNVSLTL